MTTKTRYVCGVPIHALVTQSQIFKDTPSNTPTGETKARDTYADIRKAAEILINLKNAEEI